MAEGVAAAGEEVEAEVIVVVMVAVEVMVEAAEVVYLIH